MRTPCASRLYRNRTSAELPKVCIIILTISHTKGMLYMDRKYGAFLWDVEKETANLAKHGIDFRTAAKVFIDPKRKLYTDSMHSNEEPRYFCIGMYKGRIMTVRFTYREGFIRIIGAGYWRKGREYYEKS
jgi:uncharacterized DUF497 family protein